MSFWDPTDQQLLHLVTVYLQPWAIIMGAIHSTKIQTGPAWKVAHLKRLKSFFETFPVGPNRSIEFWTEISGKSWLNGSRPMSQGL